MNLCALSHLPKHQIPLTSQGISTAVSPDIQDTKLLDIGDPWLLERFDSESRADGLERFDSESRAEGVRSKAGRSPPDGTQKARRIMVFLQWAG